MHFTFVDPLPELWYRFILEVDCTKYQTSLRAKTFKKVDLGGRAWCEALKTRNKKQQAPKPLSEL
jgi:hypothetical protein